MDKLAYEAGAKLAVFSNLLRPSWMQRFKSFMRGSKPAPTMHTPVEAGRQIPMRLGQLGTDARAVTTGAPRGMEWQIAPSAAKQPMPPQFHRWLRRPGSKFEVAAPREPLIVAPPQPGVSPFEGWSF